MAETQLERGEQDDPDLEIRHSRLRRILTWVAVGVLVLLVVALVIAWTQRREFAQQVIERELERRGVEGRYKIDRLDLRTQQLSDVVLGDPENPDLTARKLRIETRLKLDGGVDVHRIVARGVRLRGRLLPSGRVTWGELDKLLPAPGDAPFTLPDVAVDIADSTISLKTPYGPVGIALRGAGNLSGGFEGKAVVSSPALNFGACRITQVRARFDVEVVSRRIHVEGPLTADRLACPDSNFVIDDPRFVVDAWFNEGFDRLEGSARLSAGQLVVGGNRLSQVTGRVTFEGPLGELAGKIRLAARRSRIGPVVAERTRIEGEYDMNAEAGTQVLVGEYAIEDARLTEASVAGAGGALEGLSNTPLGPIAAKLNRAISGAARSFDATGDVRVVNAPSGGFAAIETAAVQTETGANIQVNGGRGIRLQWPSGNIEVDAQIRVSGGGLPTGTVDLQQAGPGGQLTGVARFAPYQAADSRLALQPIRFTANPDGTTRFQTEALLTGAFADGRVSGLRLPVEGQIGPAGKLTLARSCFVARFDSLTFRDLTLNRDSVRICPTGEAVIVQPADGELQIGARLVDPDLSGMLGDTPIRLSADSARITGKDFVLIDARMALGESDSPVVVTAERLAGTFRGAGISGTISGATAVIGNVPLLMSDIDGEWLFRRGDLMIDGNVVVSDRADPPRFYPLRSRDFEFLLSGDDIRAGGTLRHPETGIEVMDVAITHDLETGAGTGLIDVDGLTFGPALQPEELTPLTEGVVALVEGTISGRGRIHWTGEGEVTSTGDFATRDMDLALPFGPVEGLTTSIHFTDLLGLETAPGQLAQVDLINPGIPVVDGLIRYQILPDQLVKIERGVWPFMGGWLILHETILNFGAPSAKRLTFELVGLNAQAFVESLGFDALEMTGIFDGVLPMIFDEDGGRIVGGRLESRPPGGIVAYQGEIADLGFFADIAFDAVKRLRYRDMVIRLDGELAGEFATRISIDHISLDDSLTANILEALTSNIRFKLNATIHGPLRAIIATIKSLSDPTQVIQPVLPIDLDSPEIAAEVRAIEEEQEAETDPTEDEGVR